MNASVVMRQEGQSKKMAEARLSFEDLNVTILIQFFFSFLKICIYFKKGKNCIKIVRVCQNIYTHFKKEKKLY
jgi:hypothetical protein